jgi:hypothetical protein
MSSESNLFEVVGAPETRSSGSYFLNGRQQQTDEDRNNCDHHQQFNQREAHTPEGEHG